MRRAVHRVGVGSIGIAGIGRARIRLVGIALAVAAACGLVAACGAPNPSVETRVLHLESRVSQAVAVSISDRGGEQSYETALRPCGGRLDLTVGREIPAQGDWLIFLSIDWSGRLDAHLAASSGDPHDLPGDYTVLPIWSRGDIPSSDLPKWITVEETDTVLADAPLSSPISTSCAARVFETSPP